MTGRPFTATSAIVRFVAVAVFVLTAAVAQGQTQAPAPGGRPAATPSVSFTITGAVTTPRTITLADLEREPPTTILLDFSTSRGTGTARFTGVLLWSLLQAAGIKTDPAVRNDMLHRIVVVSAEDGYSVTLSAGELDPEFGAQAAIVAYERDGKPLGDSGFARLIMPGDKDPGRNIMRISKIEVR